MTSWFFGSVAVACTVSAVALLYRSWSRRPEGSRVAVATGWLLLAVAAAWWIALDGWEFGTIYAITVPSLAAAGVLCLVADRRPGRVRNAPHTPMARASWRAVRANLFTFLLVFPFGVVASTLVTSAVGLLLPFGELDQLAFIVCAVPVVWGLVAFWLTMDVRRRRPIVSLGALSGLSLLIILVR